MYPEPAPPLSGRSRRTRTLALLTVPLVATPFLVGAASSNVVPSAATAIPDDTHVVEPTNVPPAQAPLELDEPATVTLITGDMVTVHPGGLVETEPGPGREHITFDEQNLGDVIRVVPSDAAQLLAEGKLDERLFELTYLIREGYDDTSRPDLPLIIEGTPKPVREITASAGAKVDQQSRTLSMSTVAQDKTIDNGQLWDRMTSGDDGQASLPAGVDKIWLDGMAHVTLDESVPQIGAPEVWDAGYTGEGVTVAVLDTGVDTTHPDLAGQVIASQAFHQNPASLGVFTVDQVDFPIQYRAVAGASPVPRDGLSDPLVDVGRACVESEGDELLADPAGKTALIVRGPCPFAEKYDAAVEAGAAAVVFYNDQPGLFSSTVAEAEHAGDVWAGGITDTAGAALRELLDSGEDVALTFADRYPGDLVGHGTHVSATIAGTGNASDGARTGVAPDAKILNGKVLADDNRGQESWIIAGMEWAVERGADIVNISIGGSPTDGTDPLSQAVNTLTAEHDVLFVVAAGNSGTRGPSFIGTPGTADAALTVGAVDKSDQLAPFSSRGPRRGDHAVKPEVTAPGVGIVAARAAATSLGAPVDDKYTSLNGTSMATPHVAGAAALLAQARPDLDAPALRDALVSTSIDAGSLWFEQGAGRVDVARAVAQGVYADASVNFGVVVGPDPVERLVTYTNHTNRVVTLRLQAEVVDLLGRSVGELGLSRARLVVRPGHDATVSVVAVPQALDAGTGSSGGVITATGRGVSLHTAVGFRAKQETSLDDDWAEDWAEDWTATYGPVDDASTNLRGATLSPDGEQMFLFGIKSSGGDPKVVVMAVDAATGEEIWANQLSVADVSRDRTSGGIVVSPDGSKVYVSQDLWKPQDVWDPETFERDVVTIAFNNTPAEQPGDPELGERLWQASYGPTSFSQGAGGVGGQRLAITPDGKTILVTGSDTVDGKTWVEDTEILTIAYDAATGQQQWLSRHGHPDRLDFGHDISVSPAGDLAFVTGFEQRQQGDSAASSVTLAYELAGESQGNTRWVARHDSTTDNYGSWHNSVSKDGKRVFVASSVRDPDASLSDERMLTHAYDSATGELLWSSTFGAADHGFAPGHTGPDRAWKDAIAVSPNNDLMFVTGHHCEGGTCNGAYALVTVAYDQATGEERWHQIHESNGVPGRISQVVPRGVSAATSPDGSRLYVAGGCCWPADGPETSDQTTLAYDSATGELLGVARHKYEEQSRNEGFQILVSPDGNTIHTVADVQPDSPRPTYWGVSTYSPPIAISAAAYKSRGEWFVDITWSGAVGDDVEILRDGELATITENTGVYTDKLGRPPRGRELAYEVCSVERPTCSKEATVEIGKRKQVDTGS